MRPTKEDFYFAIVEAASLRSTCNRGKPGAVLVKKGRVIATGYAGAPCGTPHCDEVGHEIVNVFDDPSDTTFHAHCIRTVHAELNAILQAARFGPSTEGSQMYCKMFPCYACAQAIINAGITEVHSLEDYQTSEKSKKLFNLVGIVWTIKDERVSDY